MYYTVEEGVRYDVAFDDCCVNGGFTATLVSITPREDEDEWPTLLFDNGVHLEGYNGQVSFKPAVSSQAGMSQAYPELET